MIKMTLLTLSLLGALSAFSSQLEAASIPKWQPLEFTFKASQSYANPFQEVRLTATFASPSGRMVEARGFFAGEGKWKVRFSPDEEGRWTLETTSEPADAGLGNQRESFNCTAAVSHGGIIVDPQHPTRLAYADGTPYLHLGDTIYNLFCGRPTASQTSAFIQDAARWRINKFRVLLWDWQENVQYPFQVAEDGTVDFDRYDLAYYDRIEGLLREMGEAGICATLILRISNPPVIVKNRKQRGTAEQFDAYLRYSIARLASFSNVWWELENELSHPSMVRETGSDDYVRRMVALVREEDPYDRLVTCSIIDQGLRRRTADAFDAAMWHDKVPNDPEKEYATLRQLVAEESAPLEMPAIHDEISYEQNPEAKTYVMNGTTGDNIRRAAWLNYCAGVYWTYGAGPDRWMGLLNGEPVDPGDPYIKGREWDEYGFRFFPTLFETVSALPFNTMRPRDAWLHSDPGRGLPGRPGARRAGLLPKGRKRPGRAATR